MPVCPFCKKELQTKLSARFIDEVDPKIIECFQESVERTQRRGQQMGGFLGRLTQTAASMARHVPQHIQILIDYPPMVGIITCATCDTLLSIDTQAGIQK